MKNRRHTYTYVANLLQNIHSCRKSTCSRSQCFECSSKTRISTCNCDRRNNVLYSHMQQSRRYARTWETPSDIWLGNADRSIYLMAAKLARVYHTSIQAINITHNNRKWTTNVISTLETSSQCSIRAQESSKNRRSAPFQIEALPLLEEGTIVVNSEAIYAVLFKFVSWTISRHNVDQAFTSTAELLKTKPSFKYASQWEESLKDLHRLW